MSLALDSVPFRRAGLSLRGLCPAHTRCDVIHPSGHDRLRLSGGTFRALLCAVRAAAAAPAMPVIGGANSRRGAVAHVAIHAHTYAWKLLWGLRSNETERAPGG